MSEIHGKDWIEVVFEDVFGFRGEIGGREFYYRENAPLPEDHVFRRFLDYKRKGELLPRHLDLVLVLCLAIIAPERLVEFGFEVRNDGRVRLRSLEPLGFDQPRGEDALERSLRGAFKAAGVVGFEAKRWILLRLERGQVRAATEVVDAIVKRLHAAINGSDAIHGEQENAEDPFAEFFHTLTALLTLLRGFVAGIPEEKVKAEGARWFKRIDRWVPRILAALRAPDGRAALMKLFMAVAFPGKSPTHKQVLDLFEAMGPEVEEVVAAKRNAARRAEARTLCRAVLERRFGKLPERTRDRIAAASIGQVRNWLLRAIEARSLKEVFRSASRKPPAPPPSGSVARSKN